MPRHKLTHLTKDNSETENISLERVCNKCKENKNLSSFSIGKYTCKECLCKRIKCGLCNKMYSF